LNRQFRKVTPKLSFANDDSLRKMRYLAYQKMAEQWPVSYRNGDMVLNQLNILFADRIPA
ncbi:MAG: IS256 family transposase, partial [Clostridia bacterium]